MEPPNGPITNSARKALLANSLPIEDGEAAEIARLMLELVTSPSADAVKQAYESHLAANRIGYDRIGYALIELLKDPDPLVQSGAAIKLLQLGRGREAAIQALQYLLGSDKPSAINPLIKGMTASLLSTLDRIPDELHTCLNELLHSEDRTLRIAVAALLVNSHEAIRLLRNGLDDTNYGIAFMSAKSLLRNKIAVDHAVKKLISLLSNTSELFDAAIIAELARVQHMADVIGPIFMRILKSYHTTSIIRTVTASAIGTLGYAGSAKAEFENALLASLQSGDWETVCASSTGLKDLGCVPPRVIRELVKLFKHSDTTARGMSVVILADLGPLASSAIPDLFKLAAVEAELDVLHSIGQAIEKIGLVDHLNDEVFVESTIASLIEQAVTEERVDKIRFRLAMFMLFGTRMVPALILKAQDNNISSMRIAISSLAMIGMTAPSEVIPAIIRDLFSNPDEHVRMIGASVLAEMGQTAHSAVAYLAQTLDSGNSNLYLDVLRALRSMGPAAIGASSSVIPLLASKSEFIAVTAEETLLSMGPEVRSILDRAIDHPDSIVRRRSASLISRIKAIPGQIPEGQSVGEFHWIEDDALIKLYVAVGEILEREGPTSYRNISKKLTELQAEGSLDLYVDTHERTIAVKIKKLEKLLSVKEGRTITLTGRGSTTKGGLTLEGKNIYLKAKNYVARL